MEQQNNNDYHKAMVVVAFARIMYTVVFVVMILWTVSKAIETVSFITIAVTCKDD